MTFSPRGHNQRAAAGTVLGANSAKPNWESHVILKHYMTWPGGRSRVWAVESITPPQTGTIMRNGHVHERMKRDDSK